MIHPTALIDPAAQLADDVEVGAYAIIGAGVVLEQGCKVAAAAQLVGKVLVGAGSSIGHGAIIGADPQDLSFDPATDSGVRIGQNNTLRELVTIHRSSSEGAWTSIGNDNFLMAGTHLGHDAQMGNGNVVANNCLLAGHVIVGDHTFLGGGGGYHQFIHIGDRCMVQGNAVVSQDVPPYCIAYGTNHLAGLNSIGLRRAGFAPELRSQIKRAYRDIFLSDDQISKAVAKAASAPDLAPETRLFIQAIAEPSRKGCCTPSR